MGQSELEAGKRAGIYAEISRLAVERGPILTFLLPEDAIVVRSGVSEIYTAPGTFSIDFKYVVKE